MHTDANMESVLILEDVRKGELYLSRRLHSMIREQVVKNKSIVVICEGTPDKVGCDLGPIIGSALSKNSAIKNKIKIFGTLEEPVLRADLNKLIVNKCLKNSLLIVVGFDIRAWGVGEIFLYEKIEKLEHNCDALGDINLDGIIATRCNKLADESIVEALAISMEKILYSALSEFTTDNYKLEVDLDVVVERL